jgi:EAL and modified HD-GYP domain-containing signal transduction protein
MSQPSVAPEVECPPEIVQVGRQPILDRDLQTYGYELLYRNRGAGPAGLDGDLVTARTMLNGFLEFGLQQLAGPHRVFINLTRPFFTDIQPLPVDKSRVVLEILEDIEVDQALTDGLKRLRRLGYQLALDDYRFEPRWEPVLPHVHVVKVDIVGLDLRAHADEIAALKARGITLLAEKVETRAEFELAAKLGFDLFQGYFFARPEVVSGKRVQTNHRVMMSMLTRITDPGCSIEELTGLISQDAALSYKILRFINSAALGLPRKVDSLRQAVIYIGLERLRGWATLFTMAGMTGKPPELITSSLVRADLCHALTRAVGGGDPDSAYTIGLLSVLDALLDRPMTELVAELPLPAPMAQALVDHAGSYGPTLDCAVALEQGRWLEPAAQMLPLERLNPLYIEALERAEAARQALSAGV